MTSGMRRGLERRGGGRGGEREEEDEAAGGKASWERKMSAPMSKRQVA